MSRVVNKSDKPSSIFGFGPVEWADISKENESPVNYSVVFG